MLLLVFIRYFTKYCIVPRGPDQSVPGANDSVEQACVDLGVVGFQANRAWAEAGCCSQQLLPGVPALTKPLEKMEQESQKHRLGKGVKLQ